jgi:hypothetical protein
MSNESHQAAAQQQQQQLWQQDQVSHLDAKGAEHDCSKLVLYKLDALLGTLQQVTQGTASAKLLPPTFATCCADSSSKGCKLIV